MGNRIGEMLLSSGLITLEQLSTALKLKLKQNKRIGEILVELGYLTEEQVVKTLYGQLSGKIENVLNNMAEAELTMAEFYVACSKLDVSEKCFWQDMANDELRHAQNISEMIHAIYRRPHLFKEGIPFQVGAIRTFIEGIKSTTLKIGRGEIPPERVLFIARELEHSSIEMRYYDALKTDDEEYHEFVKTIISQDIGHRDKLDNMIAAMKQGLS